jgi:hypothetical protein
MAATLSMEVLQDEIAVTLAQVIAAANKRAIAAGIDVNNSIITIMQIIGKEFLWRINYGTRNYKSQRGGDLIIDVRANDASIKAVLRGQ